MCLAALTATDFIEPPLARTYNRRCDGAKADLLPVAVGEPRLALAVALLVLVALALAAGRVRAELIVASRRGLAFFAHRGSWSWGVLALCWGAALVPRSPGRALAVAACRDLWPRVVDEGRVAGRACGARGSAQVAGPQLGTEQDAGNFRKRKARGGGIFWPSMPMAIMAPQPVESAAIMAYR